jgi:general nucleoside transport system ATP-binding protein
MSVAPPPSAAPASPGATSPPAVPALDLAGLTKVFGDCVACEDVSLKVGHGEVVAVVGENGAGKSTLMSLAYGLYRPTRGEVRVRGRALEMRSPRDAIAAGIGMVHQHFMLVPPLTVAENVALGAEPRRGLLARLGVRLGRGSLFDRDEAERAVATLSERLGFGLDPRAVIAGCSVATQQRVEILKVLYRGAEVLILDEPTAALAPAEAEALLATVRALAAEGKSVILVAHKLREVLAVATRVAVMRRGRLVADVAARETDANALAALMVGGSGPAAAVVVSPDAAVVSPAAAPREQSREGGPARARIAALRGVRARGERGVLALRDVDIELHGGEIVAVAGVDGNGQTELAEVLCGLRAVDAGTVELAPGAAARTGLGHIPEDRQRRGLCLPLTVEENLVLGRHRVPALARGKLIARVDAPARRALAARLVEAFDVRPRDTGSPVSVLSGGNQQKVIVARELLASGRPALVVAVQPTRGLDLGAIVRVHDHLRAARDAGAAVLVVSLDLDEVRALGDRILVMSGGRIVTELPAGTDEGVIGRHMLASGAGREEDEVKHG